MTTRLYYEDAYTTAFDATVLEAVPGDGGRTHVVLDATFFYPTSGGQLHDVGTLGDATVVDVLDRSEDDAIVHVVEGTPPGVGAAVHATIDATRRARHRQQHSGQHILSAVFFTRMGLQTVSSRLGETGNTLDLATDGFTDAQLDAIEDEVNAILWRGTPVRIHHLAPDAVEDAGLRKKSKRAGPVRMIEIEGVDKCPCGGTHVRNAAEVGLVAITGTEKIKGGTRVHFWCGQRALEYRRDRQRMLDAVALRLTTGAEFVDGTVEKIVTASKERLRRAEALARELVAVRSTAWWHETPATADGAKVVVRRLDEDEALAVPTAARTLIKRGKTLAALLVIDGDRCALTLSRSEDLDVDAGALLREVVGPHGGRGGGRKDHAQGGFPAAAVDAVETSLRAALD